VYHYRVHEFSLIEEIHRMVAATADEHRLQSVARVKLRVGRLAGVSCEALEYAWSFVRGGDERTAQALLEITHIDGQGRCAACGFTGAVVDTLRICPACGAPGLRFTAGEEFLLAEISGEPQAENEPPA
jgi:hydrogenase nickel incorporation protein HypA/HybF